MYLKDSLKDVNNSRVVLEIGASVDPAVWCVVTNVSWLLMADCFANNVACLKCIIP